MLSKLSNQDCMQNTERKFGQSKHPIFMKSENIKNANFDLCLALMAIEQ